MKVKMFEIRDRMTFVVVMCVELSGGNTADNYLLTQAGFDIVDRQIQLVSFSKNINHCCPHEWNDRTYQTAHQYIDNNWDNLKSGEIIDVEYILGETVTKKNI